MAQCLSRPLVLFLLDFLRWLLSALRLFLTGLPFAVRTFHSVFAAIPPRHLHYFVLLFTLFLFQIALSHCSTIPTKRPGLSCVAEKEKGQLVYRVAPPLS